MVRGSRKNNKNNDNHDVSNFLTESLIRLVFCWTKWWWRICWCEWSHLAHLMNWYFHNYQQLSRNKIEIDKKNVYGVKSMKKLQKSIDKCWSGCSDSARMEHPIYVNYVPRWVTRAYYNTRPFVYVPCSLCVCVFICLCDIRESDTLLCNLLNRQGEDYRLFYTRHEHIYAAE